MKRPVILHVPHAATVIPASVRESILLSDSELERELLLLTDHYTDELFALPGATMVRYPVSRLVADPERFEDDAQERMAQVGMGVMYTRTSSGKPLRKPPTAQQRQHLLDTYYRPHHDALERAVEAALTAHGMALIVDCHSFPSRPLPYELDQNTSRPDFCIGKDDYHTPPELKDALISAFMGQGYRVEVNRPFSGALVPMRWYQSDRRVQSVMVEVNRALYMDELTGAKRRRFEQVGGAVRQVIRDCTGLDSGL